LVINDQIASDRLGKTKFSAPLLQSFGAQNILHLTTTRRSHKLLCQHFSINHLTLLHKNYKAPDNFSSTGDNPRKWKTLIGTI
jgi:hypothetical protein